MIKILHYVAMQDVLKHLTTYRRKRDRSVVTRCISLILKIGDMLAKSQSGGITHVLRDLLKRLAVKAGATSYAASFRILAGTSSGPEAFNSLNIPSRVISIVGIHGIL